LPNETAKEEPMSTVLHAEKHFTASETVRDIVIGMSDGLTVPFALAAGLTGAVASTNLVVVAGFAEIAAGSIAMGLGGYLAAKTDSEHYAAEVKRERWETVQFPETEEEEVAAILRDFGVVEEQVGPVVAAIRSDTDRWVDFMMRFELGLEKPDPRRARWSALTIALSYIVGGLVPLASYIFISSIQTALYVSIGMTLAALFTFGFIKGHFTGISKLRGGIQTVIIGGLAAGAAYTLARLIS
jgi:VIT1/CCC1 family predicted Fe2+/Mn2+ transporter